MVRGGWSWPVRESQRIANPIFWVSAPFETPYWNVCSTDLWNARNVGPFQRARSNYNYFSSIIGPRRTACRLSWGFGNRVAVGGSETKAVEQFGGLEQRHPCEKSKNGRASGHRYGSDNKNAPLHHARVRGAPYTPDGRSAEVPVWLGRQLAAGSLARMAARCMLVTNFLQQDYRTWIFGRCIEYRIRYSIRGCGVVVGWWWGNRVVG